MMDFRACPACKASVLEDDVEDCPFCGASMSGKPGSKPKPAAAPAAPPVSRAADRPSASTTAGGARPAAPSRSQAPPEPADFENDTADPFEVDTSAMLKVAPISPKPAKGRMVRVVCPMCETQGFITPKQEGQEVKCCNAACLMPVFTAPKPKPVEVEEAPPTRSLSGTTFIVGAVGLVALIAAGLYFFVLKDKTTGPGVIVDTPTRPAARPDDPSPGATDPVQPVTPVVAVVPLTEVRNISLTEIVKMAQQRQNNRSKPHGRKLAAESFAEVGQPGKARQQLTDMRNVQGYVAFYEIEPLVEIAASERRAGNAAGAKTAVSDAVAKASFPTVGRNPLDAASALAAELVIQGRLDDAKKTARSADDSGPRGQLSAAWREALDARTYDVDAPARRPAMQNMPSTQWVSVTQSVFAQAGAAAALEWARAADDVATRDNALAAWAWAAAATGDAALLQQAGALAGELQPPGRLRVWSAVADAQFVAGKTEAAQQSMAHAMEAVGQLPASPTPATVPSLRAIYDSEGKPHAGLPDPAPWRATALALMDAAQLQSEQGDAAAAWQHVRGALAAARAMAPGPPATEALLDECEHDRGTIDARLAETLGLEKNRVFLAFNRYRTQCGALHDESLARFDFQVDLLRRAVRLKLLQPVWDEIVAREQQTSPLKRERYFDTTLPGMLTAYASVERNQELIDQVKAALPSQRVTIDPRDRMEAQIVPAIEAGDFSRANEVVREYEQVQRDDRHAAHLAVLSGVSRLLRVQRHADAVKLATAMTDPLIREDALLLIAAASVRDGKHSELWRDRLKLGLSATEMASLYRGFVMGGTAAD